jgi:signal transduction histidine kinase/CheY-like chemotaxis protein
MNETYPLEPVQKDGVILVVDDEPGVLRLCQRLLEKEGFTVLPTLSTSQALAILAREPIRLMLVDIRMSGIDGFQLMNLARRHQPEIAVVMITGYGTVETALEALQRGADGLILKPFSGTVLIQGVQTALESSLRKREYIRLQALRPLFDVTGLLFTETDPLRLRGLILDAFLEHLACSDAGLFWQKSLQEELEQVEVRGDCLSKIDYSKFGGLIERLWVRKVPLWVSREASGEAGHIDGRERSEFEEIFNQYSLRSILCVPVVHKNGGSLLLAARSMNQPSFQNADLDLFTILARQATLALENAFLYEELRASLSELEKSQYALIQTEKMASAGRLTASIAHEINNPLQSVSNCLHLASRQELTSEDRKLYIDLAQSELERLMNIVQRVLDLYRPGARDRRPVDVDEVIRHVLLLVEPQLNNSGIKVFTDLQASPAEVMAVRNHIQQVMLNLILNAMEAMPKGGELFIITRRLDSEMEVIIEDTGPGIPNIERGSVFEPFVSSKENGTGLGLTVSYGIITAFGGSLDIIKGRGAGACFRILLPLGDIK